MNTSQILLHNQVQFQIQQYGNTKIISPSIEVSNNSMKTTCCVEKLPYGIIHYCNAIQPEVLHCFEQLVTEDRVYKEIH